jgi:hypothetical protein
MDETRQARTRVVLGWAGVAVAILGGWLVYLVPTSSEVPKETSTEAAWLIATPALVGIAAIFVLSLASLLTPTRQDQLLGFAGIAAIAVLAWAVIVVTLFGPLLLMLGSGR